MFIVKIMITVICFFLSGYCNGIFASSDPAPISYDLNAETPEKIELDFSFESDAHSNPNEILLQLIGTHFREKNYNKNKENVVEFRINDRTKKLNLVFTRRITTVMKDSHYIWDFEQWYNFKTEWLMEGLLIKCDDNGLNQVVRISYPFIRNWVKAGQPKRVRVREDLSNFRRIGRPYFKGESVAKYRPAPHSYLLTHNKKRLIQDWDNPREFNVVFYPKNGEFHILEALSDESQ